MKKRMTALVLAVAMIVLALAACGGGSKPDAIVGKWNASKIKAAGVEVDLEEFAEQMGQEISISIEFKEDGKLTADAMGVSSEGTWKAKDGGKYDVTIDEETEEVSVANNEMTLEIEGNSVVFTKEAAK